MISAVRILCKKSVTNEALSYNQGGQFYVITGGQFSVVTTISLIMEDELNFKDIS